MWLERYPLSAFEIALSEYNTLFDCYTVQDSCASKGCGRIINYYLRLLRSN